MKRTVISCLVAVGLAAKIDVNDVAAAMRVRSKTCARTHTHTRTRTHTHTHMHEFFHTHTHTHTFTRARAHTFVRTQDFCVSRQSLPRTSC